MDKHAGSDLAIFVGGFFVIWTGWTIVAWKLGIVPEPARFWLRTAIWIAPALIWVRWQKTPAPLTWLALKPVNMVAVPVSVAAVVILLVWNGLRVAVTGASIDRFGQLGGLALVSVLVGAFVEELLFRGVIQTRLSETLGSWPAVLLAAALFLLIHVPGWLLLDLPVNAQVVGSVFAIGVICGALRHSTRSIWPAVAAHWANNIGALF
jgi:membrane protease YdiL (CAAX protease family)